MEKSINSLGYHTMKVMSRDPPQCVCVLIPGVVYHTNGPLGRMEGLRPHSGLNGHEHTHTHALTHTHTDTYGVIRSSLSLPLQSTRK